MAESYVEYLKNRRGQTSSNQGSPHIATVETRYIRALSSDRSRWLHVQSATSPDSKIPICEYTKVTMIKSTGGRTYFKIADGTSDYVGQSFSLKDEYVDACLSKTPPSTAASVLQIKYGKRTHAISVPRGNEDLDQQWGSLTISGKTIIVTLNSMWDGRFSPIPPGRHRIMAPGAPHKKDMTDFYVDYARQHGLGEIVADQVWFPIELEGAQGNSSRYVHIGNLSEGCVTVYALEQWNAVYNFLISNRLPDTKGRYIAYLEVTK